MNNDRTEWLESAQGDLVNSTVLFFAEPNGSGSGSCELHYLHLFSGKQTVLIIGVISEYSSPNLLRKRIVLRSSTVALLYKYSSVWSRHGHCLMHISCVSICRLCVLTAYIIKDVLFQKATIINLTISCVKILEIIVIPLEHNEI